MMRSGVNSSLDLFLINSGAELILTSISDRPPMCRFARGATARAETEGRVIPQL